MRFVIPFNFLLIFFGAAFGQHEAYNVIFENRNTLIHNILSCSTATANLGWQCFFPQRDSIINMLQSQSNGSVEFEKKTIDRYLYFIDRFSYANSSRLVISDKISFLFLIELLKSKDLGLSEQSYEILMKKSAINEIPKYRKEIKKAIAGSSLPDYKKNQLLALTISIADKDTVFFDSSKIGIEFKAHLGDTAAEGRLIKDFEKPSLYQAKEGQIDRLIVCGTKKSLKSLIKNFNQPIFSIMTSSVSSPPCTSGTLRVLIIEGLRRHYPDIPLLNDSLFLTLNSKTLRNNRKHIAQYFVEFLNWAKKEFGITPKNEDLAPVINQGCVIF